MSHCFIICDKTVTTATDVTQLVLSRDMHAKLDGVVENVTTRKIPKNILVNKCH